MVLHKEGYGLKIVFFFKYLYLTNYGNSQVVRQKNLSLSLELANPNYLKYAEKNTVEYGVKNPISF